MRCSHCGGFVIYETDPYDGERYVCIICGRSPRITPLVKWYGKIERPTDQLWPQRTGNRVPPPTRVYE